jgi:hypothetical protein
VWSLHFSFTKLKNGGHTGGHCQNDHSVDQCLAPCCSNLQVSNRHVWLLQHHQQQQLEWIREIQQHVPTGTVTPHFANAQWAKLKLLAQTLLKGGHSGSDALTSDAYKYTAQY